MSSISDRLGLGNEVRELKLGRSFTKNGGAAFHSFRYDFKPASVDTSKGATVDIGEGHQVTVALPHVEGTAQTVFRGSKKPCQKECVLIIDHNTGEITLEKLSYNIQLKKTRAEGSSKMQQVRPITPIDSRKSSPSGHKLSPTWLGPKGGNTSSPGSSNSNINNNSSNKNSAHWSASSSSSPAAPPQTSPSMPCLMAPFNNNSISNSISNNNTTTNNSSNGNKHGSNPANSSRSSGGTPLGQHGGHSDSKQSASNCGLAEVGVLSDSSSNDSSSSGGSDSESEQETHSASQTISVANESMPKFPIKPPSMPNISASMPSITASMPNLPTSMPNMTKYNSLLSEDLQLSESGSDCDD